MSKIRRSDLILSREPTIFSWIVRKVSGSDWSHVGVCLDEWRFVSAVPFDGVCIKPIQDAKQYAIYRIVGLSDEQSQKIADYCESKIGHKYDILQALLLGWRIITDTLSTTGDDPDPDNFICSELVSEACADAGVGFGKHVDNVLPGTIAKSPLTIRLAP